MEIAHDNFLEEFGNKIWLTSVSDQWSLCKSLLFNKFRFLPLKVVFPFLKWSFRSHSNFPFFSCDFFILFLQTILLYCFLYPHFSISDFLPIHFFYCFPHLFAWGKFHISNTYSFHWTFFSYYSYTFNISNPAKGIPKLLVFHIEWKVSNKNTCFIVCFEFVTHCDSDVMVSNLLSIHLTGIFGWIYIVESNIGIHWISAVLIFLQYVCSLFWQFSDLCWNRSKPHLLNKAKVGKKFLYFFVIRGQRYISHKNCWFQVFYLFNLLFLNFFHFLYFWFFLLNCLLYFLFFNGRLRRFWFGLEEVEKGWILGGVSAFEELRKWHSFQQ